MKARRRSRLLQRRAGVVATTDEVNSREKPGAAAMPELQVCE